MAHEAPSSRETYLAAARPLIELVAQHGVHVHKIVELRRYGARCKPFVGALVAELERTPSRELLEELASVLGASWAREAAMEPLLARFRSTPNSPPATKAALAQALEFLADDDVATEFIELARDRRHGNARQALVAGLGKLDAPEVADVLVELLDDPGVGGHALAALAKVVERSRELVDDTLVKPFLRDGRPWVRREAKDFLQLLDRLK
jgi:hypothetical protein